MAQVSDLVQVGFPPNQANALGDTVAEVAAAGTTVSDATPITDSVIYCVSASGANAGFKLPTLTMSKTKKHIIINDSGVTVRAYVNNSSAESIKNFAGGGAADYRSIADGAVATIQKAADDFWVSY